ncbi:hypothetical protein P7K49_009579 [Saguinus oedipus]|uniref:Uncharacterized protein n=1 Tax=Saguinus oedipus TaxID=9490 RepID=A0ABQ9VKE2_SAGOE|nr:hypothetical protein P7K49_009579 [Saguinus oedipus]
MGLVPLGALGSLEFSLATLPLISDQYIELDINPIVKSVAGDIIDFPKALAPAKVPPKEDHTSQVVVPLYLFNTVFGLLQTNGALDMDITPELYFPTFILPILAPLTSWKTPTPEAPPRGIYLGLSLGSPPIAQAQGSRGWSRTSCKWGPDSTLKASGRLEQDPELGRRGLPAGGWEQS